MGHVQILHSVTSWDTQGVTTKIASYTCGKSGSFTFDLALVLQDHMELFLFPH
jgi:hypothetical protein